MKLYLVQHGEARPEREDPERSLTDFGRDEIQRVSRVAKLMGVLPAVVYHSGKRRARQTAEILGEALNLPLKQEEGLNPNDPIQPWVERISRERRDLMIVGHLPFLDHLASFLICGNEKARVILFRYGAIVCLEQKEDQGWAIRWVLSPEMIP
ncbi:MAG: phosphohistidine phosphatase SixA [Desulfobacterota bacterium]|nr:phosphohistidine phosphatase SixA [Thermodesulfobacteriota bacterium]